MRNFSLRNPSKTRLKRSRHQKKRIRIRLVKVVFGSVLSQLKEINLETADGKEFRMKNSLLSKIGFKLIGIPHIEMRIRAKKIFSFLPKENKQKVLDAGCGYGIYSLTFQEKGFQVTAIDHDKKRVDELKKQTDLHVEKADITNLPFQDNYFDVISCSEVIEHIKDDEQALSELSRVLKKRGILITTTPSLTDKNKLDYKKWDHERPGYSKEMIYNLADANNLIVDKIEFYSGRITESLFKINEKLYNHKILLGLLFYPLYLISLFDRGDNQNGVAVKFVKR